MPAVKRSSPSEDIMPNVLKVLDLIVMSINSKKQTNKPFHDEYTRIAVETTQPPHAKSIAKQCVGLTSKCLCSHRYEEAAKLLWLICQDRSVFDMFIFRASMIALENLEIGNRDEVIWSFLSEAQNLDLVNKKEVQLEYIIYALTKRADDAKGRTQALINMKRKNYLRKNARLDPIFEGYLTYLECMEYVELYDSLSEDTQMQTQVERFVDAAITKTCALFENPGEWDIFVLKLVELLGKCEQMDKVEDLLLKYAESNPDNLNAHIYLCLHLNEINPRSTVLIDHLKKISEMCPSDERVLILLEKWKDLGQNIKQCLIIIFMFLDYPSNKKNCNAWKMLSNFLYQAKSSNNDEALETMVTCWKSRHKSWHRLHFDPSQVPHLEETVLLTYKVEVLLYFNKDHMYVKGVLDKFPALQKSLNKDVHHGCS